jgi:hypothetical protein
LDHMMNAEDGVHKRPEAPSPKPGAAAYF